MLITKIKIKRFENSNTKLKGLATIVFDDVLMVHDIKILENKGKMFLGMPSRKMKDGTFKAVVYPVTNEFCSDLEQLIFDAYIEAGEYGCSEWTVAAA